MQNENVVMGLRSRSFYIDSVVKIFMENDEIFSKIKTDVKEKGINETITYIKEKFKEFYEKIFGKQMFGNEMFEKDSEKFKNQLKLYDDMLEDYLIKWIIIQCDNQYGTLKDEILSINRITKNRLFEV